MNNQVSLSEIRRDKIYEMGVGVNKKVSLAYL